MKMFDSINKMTVITIFGLFQLNRHPDLPFPNVVINQISDTLVKPKNNHPNAEFFDNRRFKCRVDAYVFLRDLEDIAIKEINKLMSEITHAN